MPDVTTIVISALVGAVVSYTLAIIQNILDARAKIDEGLRNERFAVYKILWKKTELLPKWPRSATVTYEQLTHLSEQMRDWYFNEGGIYLSAKSRKTYGDAQEAIQAVLEQHNKGPITTLHYDEIKDKLSSLRTQLTNDLLSRRSAPRLP